MWQQYLAIILITIEGLLILISLKYLHQINITSKDFSNIFGKAKADTSRLFKELQQLSAVTSKRDDNILSVVYHLEDIELYIKSILSILEQQERCKTIEESTNKSKISNSKTKIKL
ncbi:MAG: hypothetical protein DMENIID0002_01250 [Rickettsia endosymbiont of Sergentomyia squamirostris]|uniref:Transcriptional regulator n=1 Tax=Candidatus Tisiphia endosymbiont of Sergentomyia squamirostris TaxID=3113639 RepID=A0AAT9G6P2_9RICK